MRILFLSRWFPFPADNGAKLRIFNLLRILATRHQVHLLSFFEGEIAPAHMDALRQICSHIEVVPYRGFNPGGIKAIVGFLSKYPRSVKDTYNHLVTNKVDELMQKNEYDLVIASETDMAPYARVLFGIPTLLEELELRVYFDRYQQAATLRSKIMSGISWWKYKNYMKYLLDGFDYCTVVSQGEMDLVKSLVPGYKNISVVPNGINPEDYSRYTPVEPDSLVYAGSLTYDANFKAVDYFLRDIFPIIQVQCPQVKLYVTGRQDPEIIRQLPQNQSVIFTGYLENVQPRIAQSWVSVVPLTKGGGTRLKILESLILHTPVVSTSKGMEGLNLKPGEDISVSDEPEEFAQAVIGLLGNVEKRNEMAESGYQAVLSQYSWQKIGENFLSILENIRSK